MLNSSNFRSNIQPFIEVAITILKKPMVLISIGVLTILMVIAVALGGTNGGGNKAVIGKVGSTSVSDGSDPSNLGVNIDGSNNKINRTGTAEDIYSFEDDPWIEEGVDQGDDSSWLQGDDYEGTETIDQYVGDDISYEEAIYDTDYFNYGTGADYYIPSTSTGKSSGSASAPVKTSTKNKGPDSIVVASYNILHADHHAGDSRRVGGCGSGNCAGVRTDRQVQIITGQAGNPAYDVFGTQETSPGQYNLLNSKLRNYDVFPTNTSRMSNSKDGAVAVWWNSNKFKKFASGKAPGQSNTSKNITYPWVGLESKSTGRRFYVMSIHYANDHYGGSAGQIRKSSQQTINWVKSKSTRNTPVFVMGDFNDNLKQKLSYCVYTTRGVMQNALDMANRRNPNKACPTNKNAGIDQIYVTPIPGVKASGWVHSPKAGIYARSSDHRPVHVRLSMSY